MRTLSATFLLLASGAVACGFGAIEDGRGWGASEPDAGDAAPADEPETEPPTGPDDPVLGCDDTTCDDGDPCNGVEICVGGACVPGEPVLDADADGHRRSDCGGDDCDDLDADAYPGGTEICFDGADNDCDGAADPATCTMRGDSCSDPIPIRVPAGASVRKDFWLDLSRFGRLHSYLDAECCPWPTCEPGADCCAWEGSGPEAVYRLELGAETTITLDLVSEDVAGQPIDVILYLRDGCEPTATEDCWDDISDAGDSGTRILLREQVLPAGTYSLFVDSFEADPYEPDPDVPDPDNTRVNVIFQADS